MNIKQESSLRILFLLNLLYEKEFSKNQIIEEFRKNNVEIKKTSINNYIKKLQDNNIPIITRKIKNKNYYGLEKKLSVNVEQDELDVSSDVKKLLITQKNREIIRKAMRVFYKFALCVDDENTRYELINFGYYSKINWLLVRKLCEHCRNKDIIMIDYLLQDGKNRYITIHADMVKMGDWSDRLYLSGILDGDNKISQLPIDKIFMIKKVVKENVRMCLNVGVLTYKISEEMYKKTGLDKKEGLSKIENNVVIIRRPIDDMFFTIQRLLYFCPDLYYISDKKIKESVKEKLFILKDMYEDELKK